MSDINALQNTPRTTAQADAGASMRANVQGAFQAADTTARQGAAVAADLARQGAQAGIEAMRRANEGTTETLRRSTQAVAEGQRQIAQEAARTFGDVGRKVAQSAQGTSEEMRRFAVLPHAAEGGLRDVQQAMAGLVTGVVQINLRATQELFRLANPAVVIELQQRFAREYMDALMQGTATLVRAVRRTADETLRPLEAQIEQRQQPSYQGQGYRTAA